MKTFERAGVSDATRVLTLVERWLSDNGYRVSTRSTGALQLVCGQPGPHRLHVQADAQRVRFEFAPAAPGVALPDDAELERRVDAALGALAVKADGARCSICATSIPAGALVCPMCGMTQSPR